MKTGNDVAFRWAGAVALVVIGALFDYERTYSQVLVELAGATPNAISPIRVLGDHGRTFAWAMAVILVLPKAKVRAVTAAVVIPLLVLVSKPWADLRVEPHGPALMWAAQWPLPQGDIVMADSVIVVDRNAGHDMGIAVQQLRDVTSRALGFDTGTPVDAKKLRVMKRVLNADFSKAMESDVLKEIPSPQGLGNSGGLDAHDPLDPAKQ